MSVAASVGAARRPVVGRVRAWVQPALPLLLFFLLPLFLFWPVLWGQATLVPFDALYQGLPWHPFRAAVAVGEPHNELVSDLVLENVQWKQFAVEEYLRGELPLWQPNQLAGSPFLAAGQHSMLYPLSLLFLLLPVPVAFGWFTVLSLALAGMTMYGFARVLGLRTPAALLAGLVYQGSGFLTISTVFPMIIAGAAWLPLLLAALHRLGQLARQGARADAFLPWLGVGSVAIGLTALAGHVEILYYTLLVGALYGISCQISVVRSQKSEVRSQIRLRRGGVLAGWGGATVAVGLLLSAAQIIPLYELVSQNFRATGATLDEVLGYAWPLRQAASFVVPDLLGDPSRHTFYNLEARAWQPIVTQQPINAAGDTISLDHVAWFKGTPSWKNYVEGAGYLGILPLLLALVALVGEGRRAKDEQRVTERGAVGFFAGLSAWSLLMIFGSPLYALLFYGLPGWRQLHTPFRWIFPLTLAVSVLAGVGWQAVTERGRGRWVGWLAAGAGAVGLLLLGAMALAPGPWVAQAAKLLDRSQLAQWAFGGSATLFVSYQWANFLHLGLALLGAGLVLGAARRATRGRWALLLALLVTGADLGAAAWGFMPATPTAVAEFTPPAVAWLQARHEPGAWRYTALEKDWKVLNANSTMRYGLEDVRGYDSIILKHYVRFMEALSPQNQLDFNRVAPLRAETPPDPELLDLLTVRYLVTDQALAWPGWSLVYEDEVRIYENEDVLPRAFLLGNGTYWGLRSQDIPTERLQNLDPRREVLLQGDEGGLLARDALRSDVPLTPVTIREYAPNEVTMELAPTGGAWLVFTDVDFAGWRAFTRRAGEETERELPVMRANGAFRAVWVEGGEQTVRWKYSPTSIKTGFFGSFLGVAALGLAAAYWAWGRIYQERADEGTVRRVAKNSFAPMALQLFNKAVDTVFAAFTARLLGVEALGQYAFAVTLIWGIIVVTNFGLGTLLTRDAARDPEATNRLFATTVALRVGLYLAALPVLAALLVIWPLVDEWRGISPPTVEPTTAWAILLLALGLFPSNLADAVTAVFRAREKFEVPALVATIATFIKVSIGAGVLLAGWGIVGLAATSILTNLATLIILTVLMVRTLYRPTLRAERLPWRGMLRDALPLMINEFLATAFFRIDQFLLKPMRGNFDAGYYNVAYKFIDGLLILPSTFTLAIFPVMSRYAQGAPDALLRATVLSLRWLVLIALPLALLTTRYAEGIVLAFGGPEFLPASAQALQLLIWFLPFSFVNSLLQYVLIAADRQHALTRAYVWALGFNIVANLIAIRLVGLYGAALVTVLSEIALLLPFDRLMRRSVGPLPWLTLFARPLVALGAAALPLWWGNLPFWLAIPASLALYLLVLFLLRTFGPADRALVARLRG